MADEDDHVVEKVALCPSCKQEVAALFISDGRFLCPRCARPNEYKLWKDILDAGPRIKSLGDRLKALEDRVRNDPFVAARRSERQGQRHYPPTPRRWFQFHLATAVVVTVAVSGMIGLQFYGQRVVRQVLNPDDLNKSYAISLHRGFPWKCWTDYGMAASPYADCNYDYRIDWRRVALNCAFGIAVLVAVAFVSESILRRSASRARGPAT